jgi:hypothetical protein
LVRRDVPVQIRITAPPPKGYRVVSQQAVPETLRIAGPEGRVNAVNGAETDAINLSDVRGSTEIQATTFISDPQVRFEVSPMVTVKLTIEKTGQ